MISRANYVFSTLAVILGVLFGLKALDNQVENFYIFNPHELHSLARNAVNAHGNNTAAIVDEILLDLRANNRVAPYLSKGPAEWVFNNAGGAMGAMYIIHASITEYLIIFGTPLGTEGHTGRHTADDFFHILQGTQTAFAPGAYEPEIYEPGSVHHLRRGEAKQYKMEGSCFALEYARGWIPPMIFFGYADGLSSTLDVPTLWDTTRITAREMIGNLFRGKI